MRKSRSLEQAREEFFQGLGVPEKGVFKADPFQLQAIESATKGIDTLVVAPTGAGKTFIALESIEAHLRMGSRAIYTTPLKALSNTKFNELRKRFEPEFSVGLLTGDRKIETNADVVIATTEIYRNELYQATDRYSLVVLDEVHFIADPQRGPVWEESIILTPSASTLLMLSASISNATEIAAWLEEVRGKACEVILERHRPVELRYGFLHPEHGIVPLRDSEKRLLREVRNFYGRRGGSERGGRRGGRNNKARRGPGGKFRGRRRR